MVYLNTFAARKLQRTSVILFCLSACLHTQRRVATSVEPVLLVGGHSYHSTTLKPLEMLSKFLLASNSVGIFPARRNSVVGPTYTKCNRHAVTMGAQESFEDFVGILWDDKDVDKALALLESGSVDLSARFNGKTGLHFAALDGHVNLVEKMVGAGAAIDAVDEQRGTEGMTALMWAAMYGHAEVCDLLISLGADKSIKDKGGKTAADLAEAYDHTAVLAVMNK